MSKLKHFVVMEKGSECPMIGVINNISDNAAGIAGFNERLNVALKEHFDANEVSCNPYTGDIFDGSGEWDGKATVVDYDGNKVAYEIAIYETWMY